MCQDLQLWTCEKSRRWGGAKQNYTSYDFFFTYGYILLDLIMSCGTLLKEADDIKLILIQPSKV